ncbi:hypothetical protein FA95DRAFT_1559620 [Auriscalpium vulgare]|uniref:Uncharacterized protein n=1 Tax=Auriscalpium vulgare TaxID=40419 RepID=A0ACB8RS78_9AGAM|nr:hypothetical protein FA95DRAFT_1559620 [Auriscalpium vulgare]
MAVGGKHRGTPPRVAATKYLLKLPTTTLIDQISTSVSCAPPIHITGNHQPSLPTSAMCSQSSRSTFNSPLSSGSTAHHNTRTSIIGHFAHVRSSAGLGHPSRSACSSGVYPDFHLPS